METTHYRTCNLCEAMCGLKLTVDEGRVTSTRGDDDDVFSRGHICPKGPALAELWADPDRLKKPMRRTSNGFVEIGWSEALDEAARGLNQVQATHGRDALGVYMGNPTVHNHGVLVVLQGFLKALKTKNRFDANSLDTNPKLFAALTMFGDLLAMTVPDVDRTDYFLVLGANPAASNGSVMSLGDVRGRLQGIRKRGGKVVLLDPRRTESAAWASEHHFIRPGADAALLMALLQVLFAEKRVDLPKVRVLSKGVEALRGACELFAPERVAARVGIEAEVIRRLAREFADAPKAVAYGRLGPCQGAFGPLASWLIEALNVVTGNFDSPGGSMWASPAVDVARLGRAMGHVSYNRWRSRVRGLPELGGQLPAAVMAEEIETPGEGQIRGFISIAGNPVLSSPNGERLGRALSKLDFMVSVDCYINETTRHANLILPGVHALERSHFDLVFHTLAVRNTVKYSEPVLPKPPGALEDWEILYELGMRMGGLRFGFGPVDSTLKVLWRAGLKLSPDRVLDLGLRVGPYRTSLKKVRTALHGLDLGPLVSSREKRVCTPDGKVNLAPQVLVDDVPRLVKWLDAEAPPLVLIGRRHLRSNNSWMHNVPSLVKGKSRSALMMSAGDAARLGLKDGQQVRVTSRVGSLKTALEVTDALMPGVVSLPHGFGHQSAAETLRVAGAVEGQSVNSITDDALVEPLLGTAIFNGVPVTVEATE